MRVSMALPETGGPQTLEKHMALRHGTSAALHRRVYFRHGGTQYPVSISKANPRCPEKWRREPMEEGSQDTGRCQLNDRAVWSLSTSLTLSSDIIFFIATVINQVVG